MRQTSVEHRRDPWLCLPDGKQLWFAAAVAICITSESSWRSTTALAFIWDWWSFSAAQIQLKLPAENHSKWTGGLLEMWWEGSTGWMGGTASFQSMSCPTSGKWWTVLLTFPPSPKVWSVGESGQERSHHHQMEARLSVTVLLHNLKLSRKSAWLAASRIFSLVP